MSAAPRPRAARSTSRILAALLVVLAVLAVSAPARAGTTGPEEEPGAGDAPPAADAPAAVAPEDQASFGIGPATGESPDERAFLAYTLPPLGAVYDFVALVNYSQFPLDLAVYAADAVNSADGSVGFSDRQSQRDAAWVAFGTPEAPIEGLVSVPGRDEQGQPGRVVVPFRVTVPENAPPGDHVVGLVASLTTLGQNPGSQNIELEQRVATRVFLRVDGEAVPAVDVIDVATDYTKGARPWRTGTVDVSYTIANAGNLRAGVVPAVTVSGPFGVLERRVELEPVVDLLPGSSQAVTAQVPGVWPLLRLAVTAENEVVAPPNGDDPGLGTTRQTSTVWAVSLELLLFLGLASVVIALVVTRAVRRRRRTVTPSSQPVVTAPRQPVG